MKNFTKTIASIGLSLVAIGAMAQTPTPSKIKGAHPIPARNLIPKHSANVNRAMSGPQTFMLDNPTADVTINSNAQFYDGFSNLFVFDINNALTVADSGTNENLTANNVTSVFDTAWDAITGMGYSIEPGSASVDSIEVLVHYSNTSGKNDTVFLSVNAVNAVGFPAAAVYGVDTVVITPTFFAYNNIDSIQGFISRKHIAIPGSARNGWNFGVQMTVHAPKAQDTIGLVWNMSLTNTCSAYGGYYVGQPSAIGVPNTGAHGGVSYVNTFANGYWWWNTKGNHGDNTSLSWPLTSGAYKGYYMNVGGYYWAPLDLSLLSCCGGCTGDTSQWLVQDVYIIPFVNGVNSTGVNNISAPEFTIGQNTPNPFNQSTVIKYNLAKSSNVVFTVYDMTGRELTSNTYSTVAPGQHSIELAANQFTPGVYLYTFNINGVKVTKRMVITQ